MKFNHFSNYKQLLNVKIQFLFNFEQICSYFWALIKDKHCLKSLLLIMAVANKSKYLPIASY